MTSSREESRRIVNLLHPGNRFRLMAGQPFLPGDEAGVQKYEEAMRQIEEPKEETTNERKL